MLSCAVVCCMLTALSACGGGGGASGPTVTPNAAPIARIAAPGPARTGQGLPLNGSASTDPESASLTYAWRLVTLPADSLSTLSGAGTSVAAFTPDIDGNYTVELTVTDPAGLSNVVTSTVTATSSSNLTPTIRSFTTNAASVTRGTSVRFDWKVVDPNAEAVRCTLDPMGDGNLITISDCVATQSATYTYNTPGSFRPRLTAIDARNASATADATQEVIDAPTIVSVSPAANAYVTHQFNVKVFVRSTLDFGSLTARIGSLSVLLHLSSDPACQAPACTAVYEGTMDVSGMPEGALTLEITAQDVQGRIGRHSQTINFDDAAVLTVTSPLNDSVARPTIDIAATCTDAGGQGCTVKVFNGLVELASGSGGVNQALDLGANVGARVTLRFVAIDARNQTTETTRQVYVDSAPRLSVAATVGGPILDVRASRVLYRTTSVLGESLHVLERSNGSITDLPVPAGKTITVAYLTNYGVMLVTQDVGGTVLSSRIYDWNNNVLYDLGYPDSASSLQVNGSYAVWNNNKVLWRRDLATRTNLMLSSLAGNWENGIAANGTAAWWSTGYQIFMYNGVTSQISNDTLWNTYVRTDGHYTVYRKHTPCCSNQTYAITLYDGVGEKNLRPANALEPVPGADYQIRDGWVAYTDIGNFGQRHVWTYDAQGNKVQRTFFGVSSYIDTLGDGGNLMFISGNRRYLSTSSGASSDVNSSLGKAYQVGDQWLVSIGRVLFELSN
jgi:hypothetical protein